MVEYEDKEPVLEAIHSSGQSDPILIQTPKMGTITGW
jgi:hypothetical protein